MRIILLIISLMMVGSSVAGDTPDIAKTALPILRSHDGKFDDQSRINIDVVLNAHRNEQEEFLISFRLDDSHNDSYETEDEDCSLRYRDRTRVTGWLRGEVREIRTAERPCYGWSYEWVSQSRFRKMLYNPRISEIWVFEGK